MSAEPLSQKQIDQLFGSGDAPQEKRVTEMRAYDFRRPNLISKDRMRALDAMYGHLAKSLELWLMGRVRGSIELDLLGVEQLSFGELVMSLPNPCSSYLYDIGRGGQQALVDFGSSFAFFLVDRLLGSTGEPQVQDRVLTPLERLVVRIVAERVGEQIDEIWRDHVPVDLKLSGFEAMPDMLRIANREDPMLVANVQVRAAGTDSPLLICLPFGPLDKFFSGTGEQRPKAVVEATGERRIDRVAVESSVRGSLVDVTATLPPLQLSMRDIARLSPGYTVMTGLAPTSDVTVAVGGNPRFIGSAGRADGQLAIRINDVIETGDDGRITANRRMATVATAAFDKKGGQGGSDINLIEMEPGAADPAGAAGLSSLFHLSLPITIELGRARMSVQEVLELGRGSVIQLDRLVGEPVDIIVGDRRFAEGEVVVLGEQFGVRITRVIAAPSAA